MADKNRNTLLQFNLCKQETTLLVPLDEEESSRKRKWLALLFKTCSSRRDKYANSSMENNPHNCRLIRCINKINNSLPTKEGNTIIQSLKLLKMCWESSVVAGNWNSCCQSRVCSCIRIIFVEQCKGNFQCSCKLQEHNRRVFNLKQWKISILLTISVYHI